MMRIYLFAILAASLAGAASAQMRPIFDPDDFVDPRQHAGVVLDARLIAGGVSDFIDDYRPLHENVGFVEVANNLYWSRAQFTWKLSRVLAPGTSTLTACGCSPPIYFPTPPGPDSTPAAPPPATKNTLQVAGYYTRSGAPGDPPVMLRYRISWSAQGVDTRVRSGETGEIVSHVSGQEQTLGAEVDTDVRIAGHDLFGTVTFARNARDGTIDDRRQRELAYVARFPGTSYRDILFRATMTVGAISGRGGTALNLVNPAVEAFWHHDATHVNVHLVWSPQTTRSGAGGWQTHHQIALFVDRGYLVRF